MVKLVAPHDHAVFLYKRPEELCTALTSFTKGAMEQDELVVFVHAYRTRKEAIAFLDESGFAFRDVLDREFFLLSFYEEAFEGGSGRIDFDHVMSVVDSLLAQAESTDRKGLAVFVDASRSYLAGGRSEEWFVFEERLGRRLRHKMALVCAYTSASVGEPGTLERVLLAHQYRFEP